jgi:catechol 2,3-dioxygenase-like lactoylglutathione lyase family enzyme
MSLSGYTLNASIAVSDMARASEFYEDRLGLAATGGGADGSKVYESALHVYPSTENAGMSAATLATWYVDDVERVVDELAARGVTFEHYDGIVTDEKGISPRAGGGRIAWFKDPDGNTFAVEGDV